jgi:hypothetical protein
MVDAIQGLQPHRQPMPVDEVEGSPE